MTIFSDVFAEGKLSIAIKIEQTNLLSFIKFVDSGHVGTYVHTYI
jgi:hypothetical protein